MKLYRIYTPSESGFSDVDKTIKIGFPTATIININNTEKSTHHSIITNILNSVTDNEPIVLCDADIIFYDNMESKLLGIGGPYSFWLCGNLIPNYWNNVVEANEIKRFHTSLLYFPAPLHLLDYIKNIPQYINFPLDCIAPFIYGLHGLRFFYDTCANLYHLVAKERLFNFTSDILDCYSHIGCGSILDYVVPKLTAGEKLLQYHTIAKNNPESLKYLWKEQQIFYRNNQPRV